MTAKLLETQVNLDGLLDVLGKNLYSTPAVAIRELIQNAQDACVRRQLEQPENQTLYAIELHCDPSNKTLTIKDNGSGLTDHEITEYLATVGTGYTRQLRDNLQSQQSIGYFGLGFLSAYVVSDKVELWTSSYKTPEQGWHFSSRGGKRYSVQSAQVNHVGTTVKLSLNDTFDSLSEPEVVAHLVQKYCCLLPIKIYMQQQAAQKKPALPLNNLTAPWALPSETSPLALKKAQMTFAELFENQFTPLCTIPIDPNNPAKLNGLLWLQDAGGFATSDFRNVSVFIRNMHISSKERELLPSWAGFVGCIIETNTLTPTASREDIQKDENYHIAQNVLAETLISGLRHIAKHDLATWRRIILRHSQALLGAAVHDDELFALMANELKLPTNMGDMTISQIIEQSGGHIYLRHEDRLSYEDILFQAKSIPVVSGYLFAAAQFCLKYSTLNNTKVIEVGKSSDESTIFPNITPPKNQQDYLKGLLSQTGDDIRFSQFSPIDLPLVIIQDTDVKLKKRIEQDKQDKKIGSAALMLATLYTDKIDDSFKRRVYINMDCPLITELLNLEAQPQKAQQFAQLLRAFMTIMAHDNKDETTDFAEQLSVFSQSLQQLTKS